MDQGAKSSHYERSLSNIQIGQFGGAPLPTSGDEVPRAGIRCKGWHITLFCGILLSLMSAFFHSFFLFL